MNKLLTIAVSLAITLSPALSRSSDKVIVRDSHGRIIEKRVTYGKATKICDAHGELIPAAKQE